MGDVLDLLENDALRKARHKSNGVTQCGVSDSLVIEREIRMAARSADRFRQSRLPALARAVDQYRRRIGERLMEGRFAQSGVLGLRDHRLIVSSPIGYPKTKESAI